MKKIYLSLLLIIVGGIVGILSLTMLNSKNEISKDYIEEKFDEPEQFTKYFKQITTKFGKEESGYQLNYKIDELNKAILKRKGLKLNSKFTTVWEKRGPNNVGGRTRGLIVDPDDATNKTWFAAAVGGGVWKTTDGGQSWNCLTDNLPNLSANALEMSKSNHNIIYLGTGEGFGNLDAVTGNGIFKSTDKGSTWTQLSSTIDNTDFSFVNRLAINPTNPDIVIAATNTGIFKSIDGGISWTEVYASNSKVQDLRKDPTNFNILYATENGVGVLKSIDAGDNWLVSSDGLGGGKRFEISVSPANSSIIYVCQEFDDAESYIYRSTDAGATWVRFEDKDGTNINYLNGQGWYDNTIAAHPYNEDVTFFGGVNLWKVDFSDPGTISESDEQVLRVDQIDTKSFLKFQSFTSADFAGILGLGNSADNQVTESDFVSVEIRFGPGMTQKAHRFTVGGVGAGVPDNDYIYEDYVDVPFEVWDITNNKQLMVSFRDQEEDGTFSLELEDSDATKGREYLFINGIDYSETASSEITKNGGHAYKQIYFLWCRLTEGATWDDSSLPDSKVSISYGTLDLKLGTTTNISDGYGQYSGNNPDLHVDQHNILMIPINEVTDSFLVLNANDGGLGISYDSGNTFEQLDDNYLTTQFYGTAKKPGADEYIGGMQDNGTWRSPSGVVVSATTDYLFQIGGDGFECIWNNTDADKIIGGSQRNGFRRTLNGGEQWISATTGITDGPFFSKLSSHIATPDNLYAIGAAGVYKTTDFADSWKMVSIGDGWSDLTSQHNVEVSLANSNIIWAGAGMSNGRSIFLSTDQGETYGAVSEYTEADVSGYISGIATHPFEDSTAYLLFSLAGEPKIIKTTDLGQNWEDITGFVGNSSSNNGFPNVATLCLVVLPNDPSTIWVGTDIGLFESNDDGETWHYADNGIPAVSIYDMFVQDDQVVVATHGRGIWTATIDELKYVPEVSAHYGNFETIRAKIDVDENVDSLEVYLNSQLVETYTELSILLDTIDILINEDAIFKIKAISYLGGDIYQSIPTTVIPEFNPTISVSKVSGENNIEITSNFTENYDSVIIIVNDNYYSSSENPTSGNTSFFVPFTESKTYTIYIEAYLYGNAYKSNTESVYGLYLGISDYAIEEPIVIYPNPSNGLININFGDGNTNYQLDVYTLSGVKVHSEFVQNSNQAIDLQKLKNGIYLVNINKEGKSYNTKIQIRK